MGDFITVEDGTILSLSVLSPEGRNIIADNEFSTHGVDQLQDKNYSTKIFGRRSLHNKPVQFQLDSGAACNALRQEDLPASAHVKETKMFQRMYDGTTVKPIGLYQAKVKTQRTPARTTRHF